MEGCLMKGGITSSKLVSRPDPKRDLALINVK